MLPVWLAAALAPAAILPALSTTTGFFAVTLRATSTKRRPSPNPSNEEADGRRLGVVAQPFEGVGDADVGRVADAEEPRQAQAARAHVAEEHAAEGP